MILYLVDLSLLTSIHLSFLYIVESPIICTLYFFSYPHSLGLESTYLSISLPSTLFSKMSSVNSKLGGAIRVDDPIGFQAALPLLTTPDPFVKLPLPWVKMIT